MNPFLTEMQLAERWQIPRARLQAWRAKGKGPPWTKLGRAVRYSLADVEAFENDNTRNRPAWPVVHDVEVPERKKPGQQGLDGHKFKRSNRQSG